MECYPDLDPGFDVDYQPVRPVDDASVHADEGEPYDDEPDPWGDSESDYEWIEL